jgi:prepilin-type N-terminal cleavage/methylation domain-containing protein
MKTNLLMCESEKAGTVTGFRRSERGLTLPEVLIAMLIIGSVMVAMFAALSSGFSMCARTRENLHATQIMMRKIEDLRLCNWAELTNNISFTETYNPPGGGGIVYSGTITTNTPDAIPATASYRDNMRLVTVSINWTSYDQGRAFTHQRQIQTFVSRFGLQSYLFGD